MSLSKNCDQKSVKAIFSEWVQINVRLFHVFSSLRILFSQNCEPLTFRVHHVAFSIPHHLFWLLESK